VVGGATPLPAEERVAVYRRMYLARLVDVLREDYPRVSDVLGAERFAEVARSYVAAFPSTQPSARHVGAAFPDFLAVAGSDVPAFLPDLARLEWARLEVFDAPDVRALTLADLEAIGATDAPALSFALVPACIVLVAAWPVHEVWKESAAGARLTPARTALRVWREGFSVYHACMDASEEAALARVAADATFAEVCEVFAERVSLEDAARQAGALLARWLEDGILIRRASRPGPSRSARRSRGSSCS